MRIVYVVNLFSEIDRAQTPMAACAISILIASIPINVQISWRQELFLQDVQFGQQCHSVQEEMVLMFALVCLLFLRFKLVKSNLKIELIKTR